MVKLIQKASPASGLTILELLVTVTILTLLAGLLLPAILQARAIAHRNACRSNMRQWALAAAMYADIHAGDLPYRGYGIQPIGANTNLNRSKDWFNELPPLIENTPYGELDARAQQPQVGQASVWICPDAEPIGPIKPTNRMAFFPYGMNMALSPPFNGRPDNMAKLGPLQTMVFMADGLGSYCAVLPSKYGFSPIARHIGNTVNIAFLDGRVEAYAGDEVGCGIGDPERPDVRWFPPNSKWRPDPST